MTTLDAERMLVAKAVHGDAVTELIAKGVQPQHFADPECRQVWEFLRDHLVKHKQPATLRVVRAQFPQVRIDPATKPLSFVLEKFIVAAKRRLAIEALRELADAANDEREVQRIDELFLYRAQELAQAVPSPSVGRFSQMKQRIADYHDKLKRGSKTGIPLGIPDFDKITQGVQPHELLSIAGWQGTGKSTLMQYLVWQAYVTGVDAPLVFSLEMEKEALFRKFDTLATHFSYMALKSGTLDKRSVEEWKRQADRAEKASSDIVVIDDVGRCSAETVYAETVRHKPGLVAIDYVSLMDSRDGQSIWERVTSITKALKQQSRSLKVPIIAVAQTNIGGATEGAELHNIAYSRSIGQDSDIVLGLHADSSMRELRKMELRMLKNRDGPIATVSMRWDVDAMRFEPWTDSMMFGGAKRPDAK